MFSDLSILCYANQTADWELWNPFNFEKSRTLHCGILVLMSTS